MMRNFHKRRLKFYTVSHHLAVLGLIDFHLDVQTARFHPCTHLAQLLGPFCQILSYPNRIGRQRNIQNGSQPKPGLKGDGSHCTESALSQDAYIW